MGIMALINDILKCRSEQLRCLDELPQYPLQARGIYLGISDWMYEEIMIMEELKKLDI